MKLPFCKVLLALLLLQEVYSWDKRDANITTIYLISSCHLDVGFANTAQNIVNEYFDKYFPDAIKVAKELRDLGGEERLMFTTHPYLVYLYTNCQAASKLGLHCPSKTQLDDFTAAVQREDITWHAFPFNAQVEFYDTTMANFGFSLTHSLDRMYGRAATTTMSQRDIPGTTRSLIPLMKKNGVKALTVGVNTATMPPAVPSVFNWKDPISGDQVIGMWHPHGYGGSHGPKLEDVVTVPGLDEALAFAIRGDNSGPPSVTEVISYYNDLRKLFPGAKIVASGYDTFVQRLLTVQDKLPTFTQEIGDVWIYGIQSDPYKTAASRLFMRHFNDCLVYRNCILEDAEIFAFAALVLKNGEHTWGEDVKIYLHDYENWTNAEFHPLLNEPNYQSLVDSWMEQRNWGLNYPFNSLEDEYELKVEIRDELNLLKFDGHVDTSSFKEIDINSQTACGDFKIGFSAKTGAINNLQYLSKTLATDDNPIAQILYQTFTAQDYNEFLNEYVYEFRDPYIYLDLGKLGLPKDLKKFDVSPIPKSLWFKEADNSCVWLLESTFDSELVKDYGAPEITWAQVEIQKASKTPELSFTVYLVNKTATRLPESLSFYFNPSGVDVQSMKVSKLGEYVSVLDVLNNGSKHLHACDENGVLYNNGSLKVQSDDVALVCIGYPNPFPTPVEQPDLSKGFSFNIVNNIWGTNYIMWYPYLSKDKDSKYRFRFTFHP